MREIRFRCWNGEQMVSPDYIDRDGIAFWKENSIPTRGTQLMQYTGFKANGHELYEGDIIENDGDWYQITWDEDEGRWEATGIQSTGESLALWELSDSQETWVQGNIYENPELLLDKDK